MALTMMKIKDSQGSVSVLSSARTCAELEARDEAEALHFLAKRPVHTVFMATQIRDNGAKSPHNRGSFFICRDRTKKIEGIALIGHATIIEARTDHAVAAFAQLAAQSQQAHLIRGERNTVESFWKHYSKDGQRARLVCREMLFEMAAAKSAFQPVNDLRPATLNEAEHVAEINAQLAVEERDSDPRQTDPDGFRSRIERRISQKRIWIWMRDGRPIFKADVVGETPEMIYLEGIHVRADERLKGYGEKCLMQLCSNFARQNRSVCLTVNQRKANVAAFYVRAGFDFHSEYETIYLG